MSISIGLTDERRDLQRSIRGFASRRVPTTAVRDAMASPDGYDRDTWQQLAQDLGVSGTAVPEAHGGFGGGYGDLAIVFEELGRHLVPSPIFGTVALALPALIASGDEHCLDKFARSLADGSRTGTVAWMEGDGKWTGGLETVATPSDGAWRISGHKTYVVDAAAADIILVSANAPGGLSIFAISGDQGVQTTQLPTFDQTRRMGRLELSSAPATLVGKEGEGHRILSEMLQRATILLSAEMVGGAEACLEMSVGYAKVREQFGRQIGSFQAIKHKCADVLAELEAARTAVYYAAWAADTCAAELPAVVAIAKATASEAYFRAAGENVQIHGGIGTTWAHDAHLFLKRAKTSYILLGDPTYQRRRLAETIGLC